MSEETPFSPEGIDEQIERFFQTAHQPPDAVPMPPEQRLVSGLQALFSAERAEISNAQQRGRERLLLHSPSLLPQKHNALASDQHRSPDERHPPMQNLRTLLDTKHKRLHRISSLVAVLML